MKEFKVLSMSELEVFQGGSTPWSDLPTYFKIGDKIGRWLAHRPSTSGKQPVCYNYGPAYPAPVLPCR